jgi:hypothetical protein
MTWSSSEGSTGGKQFTVKRRPASGEADLVIRVRDEPRRGARWKPKFRVFTALPKGLPR